MTSQLHTYTCQIMASLDLPLPPLVTSPSTVEWKCWILVIMTPSERTLHALYNMLTHPSSRLVTMYMLGTSLSSPSAITLFTAISKGNKLKELNISNNLITDEACDVIATTMKNNTSLVWLWMSYNKISGEAAQCLVNAPMVRAKTVRPDHLCCHKWSGRTICACITGPPGPYMSVQKWSGLNINGPPPVFH